MKICRTYLREDCLNGNFCSIRALVTIEQRKVTTSRESVGCHGSNLVALFTHTVIDIIDAVSNVSENIIHICGWVYKDVIFDTSPVAGKVYKNSENRRKQGVSCGFRCICRCSICPIRAQPRCP